MPNIILKGPQGSGKKTMAKLIAKKYGGDTKIIDATIHKSKDVVVINHANKDSTDCINILTYAKSKNRPEFIDKKKVIIITNFEEMTVEAQNALRSIIETYSVSTRFILTCNDLNEIIEPIQSRFNIFEIRPLSTKNMRKILSNILGDIMITIDEDIIEMIILISDGDIKKAINYLQVIAHYPSPTIGIFNKISRYKIHRYKI